MPLAESTLSTESRPVDESHVRATSQAVEMRALAAIEEHAMLGCLEELLRIPSVSGSPEENRKS